MGTDRACDTPESSSMELGPTPGSGMALDSQSESFNESDSESDTIPNGAISRQSSSRQSSVRHIVLDSEVHVGRLEDGDEASGLSAYKTPADSLIWSAQVESMLNNPPPSTFDSFHISADPSLSGWTLPTPKPPSSISYTEFNPVSIPVAGTMGNISPILETSIPYSDAPENASIPPFTDITPIPEVTKVGTETLSSEKIDKITKNNPPGADIEHRSSPNFFLEGSRSSPPLPEPIEDFTQYPSN